MERCNKASTNSVDKLVQKYCLNSVCPHGASVRNRLHICYTGPHRSLLRLRISPLARRKHGQRLKFHFKTCKRLLKSSVHTRKSPGTVICEEALRIFSASSKARLDVTST